MQENFIIKAETKQKQNPYTVYKETLTLLKMLVKQYTAKRKMILENIITDTVKKTKSRKMNEGNIDYPQVLVIQRRFCQLQTNSPIQLQKTLVIWDFFEQADYMLIITFFLVQ